MKYVTCESWEESEIEIVAIQTHQTITEKMVRLKPL